MKVMEYEQENENSSIGYGLGLNILTEGADDLIEQFSEAGGEILGWNEYRGEKCQILIFTILCQVDEHEGIKYFLEKVYLYENNLGPLFQKWDVRVHLLTENGTPVEEYILEPTEDA